MQLFFQRNRVLVFHIAFWCVYLSFFVYQLTAYQTRREEQLNWFRNLTLAGVQVAFTMLIAYLNYFYALPRFLKHKKVWQFLLEFTVPFALFIWGRIHLQRFLIDGYTKQVGYFYSSTYVVQLIFVTLFIVIFIAMLRFLEDWFQFEARKREVENERLMAELNFLKAQINPHFLFNTLNNLYYLAYSQSPNTTEVVAKLSQMMRYMIYESNHQKVLLKKEIEYMENYISLERLRLNNEIPIEFNVTGNIENVWIAPLIFITFLENAFKHGVSNNNPNAWIKISIDHNHHTCTYTVQNTKIPAGENTLEKSGIGLQNVKRRLALSYPENHTLMIDNKPDVYFVELNLKLS